MKVIIENIESWAKEKGLHDADSFAQFAKHVEEGSEYLLAYRTGESSESCMMELGDNVVTLTILAMQQGVSVIDCAVAHNYLTVSSDIALINGGIAEGLCKRDEEIFKESIGEYYHWIMGQSKLFDSSLEECAEMAYNKIAGRKTKMVGSTLIKEADL